MYRSHDLLNGDEKSLVVSVEAVTQRVFKFCNSRPDCILKSA